MTKKNIFNRSIAFLIMILVGAHSSAATIPACNDKRVLRWVEDVFFGNYFATPRAGVTLKFELLSETLATTGERHCEVYLRSKLSAVGLKEMNRYLEAWEKGTGSGDPPYWFNDFQYDSVQRLNYTLRYDLIKREWFGKYSGLHPKENGPLDKYTRARLEKWEDAIKEEKIRIAWERERIAKLEKERAEAVEKEKQLAEDKRRKLEMQEKLEAQRRIDWAPFYADGGELNFCQGGSPEYPRKAIREGISGVVRARLFVTDGKVDDVAILSGPRVFHPAVESILKSYHCRKYGFTVETEKDFVFKLD